MSRMQAKQGEPLHRESAKASTTLLLRHPISWLWVGAVSLMLIIGLSVWQVITSDLDARRMAASNAVMQFAETYESQLIRSMREIDQSLRLVAWVAESQGAQSALKTLRDRDMLLPEQFFKVSIRPALPLSSHRLPSQYGLFVDMVKSSESSIRLQFVRVLPGAEPLEVVIAVDANYFVAGYNEKWLGLHGSLSLLDTRGVTVARAGESDKVAGDAAALLSQPFVASRPLFGFPFTAVVSLSEREQMAPVKARTQTYMILGATGNACIFLVSLLLGKMRRRLDIERQGRARDVERMAYTDALTGLANRHLFGPMLRQSLSLAQRQSTSLSLLFIDLDGFKKINDTLGHEAGDELLKQAAGRISQCIRECDFAARFGGDEFVILLSDLQPEGKVEAAANRLIAEIGKPYDLHGRPGCVTASIGISRFPGNASTAEELLRLADAAMYVAKSSGKNNFVVAPVSPQ